MSGNLDTKTFKVVFSQKVSSYTYGIIQKQYAICYFTQSKAFPPYYFEILLKGRIGKTRYP